MSGGAANYALIWRIVKEARIPLGDIEANWSFERMASFACYLDMANDYRSAWGEFYQNKKKETT